MDLETIKRLVREKLPGHAEYIAEANLADAYYDNSNDIEREKRPEPEEQSPLRNADNRVSHNFYQILVDQTASYMFTYPPTFDLGEDALNKRVQATLGDRWQKVCTTLSIEASNHRVAWLHVWRDSANRFRYAPVDGREVVPLYGGTLDRELEAVLRRYTETDDEGVFWTVYEYWTDAECFAYRQKSGTRPGPIQEYNRYPIFDVDTGSLEPSNVLRHDWGEVPFIEFDNNNKRQNDLRNVKKLIDVYDKVTSGYINDIEDVQQVIFLLEGYGGQDLNEFLGQLKKYKVINADPDPGQKANVSTLSIEIPVEARNKLTEIVEKNIYRLGQGVDINPDKLGQAKGVVIDHLYGFLELKAGLKETEFREGFGRLVRMVLHHLGRDEEMPLSQTWQRNKIRDDLELSQIIANLKDCTSRKNIARANPLVADPDEELKLLAEEEAKQRELWETPEPPRKGAGDAP